MEKTVQPITKRTFAFAVRIVKLCQTVGSTAGVSQPLVRQLIRSGTSVGANVEEAQAAQSRADFIHKMEIALKELRETRYWLRLLVATDLMSEERMKGLIGESEELVKIMSKIVVNTKGKDKVQN